MKEDIIDILLNYHDDLFTHDEALNKILLLLNKNLLCQYCGYEINPAGICINMNCSSNENP